MIQLRLPTDVTPQAPLLSDLLPRTGPGVVIRAIAAALPALAERLALGALPGDPAAVIGTNESGDKQKALDIGAHDHMLAALMGENVAHILSEEAEDVIALDPGADWDLAIDPIDGSGSIGTGAPLGTLFAIFPATGNFHRSGREVVAAGYVSFGHSVDLVISLGHGITILTWDARARDFRLARQGVTLEPKTTSLAYNASNEGHWPPGLQRWAADIRQGKSGPRGKSFNMRWMGAAVGDLHRILLQGGVFLYPADARKGYENGRLRLIYEAFPIAFLIEQAGGAASDGQGPILDRTARDNHQHTPLICGASAEVARITRYLQAPV